jgi:hypothetical protein
MCLYRELTLVLGWAAPPRAVDAATPRADGFSHCLRLERLQTRQQHIEHHTKRVHVGARVNIVALKINLLRTHVPGGTDELSQLSKQSLVGEPDFLRGRLGESKVDNSRHWVCRRLR